MSAKQQVIGQTIVESGDVVELRLIRGELVYASDRRIDWQQTPYEAIKIFMDKSEWLVVMLNGKANNATAE